MEELVRLCRMLVRESFGPVVERVAVALLRKGKLSLREAIVETKIPLVQVRDSLLVLLQHNLLVISEELATESAAPPLYSLNVDHVLLRIRFPQFLRYAKQLHGVEGWQILEELLIFGRLNRADIVQQVVAERQRVDPTDRYDVVPKLEEALACLIRDGYICSVDPVAGAGGAFVPAQDAPLPALSTAALEKDNKKRKAPPKKAAAKADAPPKQSRAKKAKPPTAAGGSVELALMAEAAKGPEAAAGSKVPAKATAETFDFRNFLGAIAPTSLWRVNFKRFNTAFQKEACSQFLADKYEDPAVSKIVAVMFNDNLPLPSSEGSDLHTYPMSGAAIARAVLESTAGDVQFGQLMPEAITGYLDVFSRDRIQIVTRVQDGGSPADSHYRLNVSNLLDAIRRKYLESLVLEKFGLHSLRIFRLLTFKKMLEQKQVAELALLPMKEARTALYQLLHGDFVQLQEVAKASDHAPHHTFYLFTVRLPQVYAKVRLDMLKSLGNLWARRQALLAELEALKPGETRADSRGTRRQSTEEQQERQRELQRQAELLEAAASRLDVTFMHLFHFVNR
jgi:DNA-directed RNA polymerase III subunit RPC3